MRVIATPNVRAALRADPVAAIVVEALARDPREGYLRLFRSSHAAPFDVRFYAPGEERRDSSATDLLDAIAGALGDVA